MGFWIFILIMAVLVPITLIGFGKIFFNHSPKNINRKLGWNHLYATMHSFSWFYFPNRKSSEKDFANGDGMDTLLFIIIMGLCGLLFISLGYLIWIKERINLIHDYHWTKVKEANKKPYTRLMGKSMIVMGVGFIFSAILSVFIEPVLCSIPACVLFVFGLCIMIYAQKKYNHGIF